MEMLYLWIKEYNNIKEESFIFSPSYDISYSYEENKLSIKRIASNNFYRLFNSNNNLMNLTAIMGENGSGKSSLLEFIRCASNAVDSNSKKYKFLAIYSDKVDDNIKLYWFSTLGNGDIRIDTEKEKVDKLDKNPFVGIISYDECFNPGAKPYIIRNKQKVNVNDTLIGRYTRYESEFFKESQVTVAHLTEGFNMLETEKQIACWKDVSMPFSLQTPYIYVYLENISMLIDEVTFTLQKVDEKTFKSSESDDKTLQRELLHRVRNRGNKRSIEVIQAQLVDQPKKIKEKINGILENIDQMRDDNIKSNHNITSVDIIRDHLICKAVFQFFILRLLSQVPKSQGKINNMLIYSNVIADIDNICNIWKENIVAAKDDVEMFCSPDFLIEIIDVCTEMSNVFPYKGETHTNKVMALKKCIHFLYDYGKFVVGDGLFIVKCSKEEFIEFFTAYRISTDGIYNCLRFKWSMSSGEYAFFNMYAWLYDARKQIEINSINDSNSILLLLDEVNAYMHPRWQQEYIKRLLDEIVIKLFKDYNVQVILTSHSPIILSDIPSSNVIYLKKGKNVSAKYRTSTFAQNIYSLYMNSFFLNGNENENIWVHGSFAEEYLKQLSDELNHINESLDVNLDERMRDIKASIELIGEDLIRMELMNKWYRVRQKIIKEEKVNFQDAFIADISEIVKLDNSQQEALKKFLRQFNIEKKNND